MVVTNQMNLFSMVERPPLEEWTFADLKDWANTLIPGWKVKPWDGREMLYIEKSKCEITLSLGHFSDSYKGGIACIHFDANDLRNGFSGMGYASEDISQIEQSILKQASEFWRK